MNSSSGIDLDPWFSFPLSGDMLPEAPAQDYYIDFEFQIITTCGWSWARL